MSLFFRLYQKILSPYHYLWAFFSALFLGFPGKSKKIKIIGITGTKGKSSVVEFTEKILEETGYKVASFSSIKIKIKNKEKKNLFKMTMPGRWHIQKFLKNSIKAGCDYAILEATSEGILQHRHKFIDFEVAVFTNLSPEHIERHGSFENYKREKGKLFKENRNIHILNLDDKSVNYFLKLPAKKKYGFKIKSEFKLKKQNLETIEAEDIKEEINFVEFKIKNIKFKVNLLGSFNVFNALASICIGLSQGVSLEVSKKALEKIEKVSGRMEIVIEQPFKVIVDYAHTPDSLIKVYENLLQLKSKIKKARKSTDFDRGVEKQKSKMICVLGAAGGGRDKWKRKKLGEIAGKYCDTAIVTNEDPYDENPMAIINEVAKGVESAKNNQSKLSVYKILDRKKAINKALKLAQKDDIVIITGKGCEPWMCVAGGKKIAWDDRKIVKEEFEKYLNKS